MLGLWLGTVTALDFCKPTGAGLPLSAQTEVSKYCTFKTLDDRIPGVLDVSTALPIVNAGIGLCS